MISSHAFDAANFFKCEWFILRLILREFVYWTNLKNDFFSFCFLVLSSLGGPTWEKGGTSKRRGEKEKDDGLNDRQTGNNSSKDSKSINK